MKTKYKILLLSMFMFAYASCSKTETGVIQTKQNSTVVIRMVDDTTVFRVLDFTTINTRKPQSGIYGQSILDGKYAYQLLRKGDTLKYQNPYGHDVVIVNNWTQIHKVNGMKPQSFLRNRSNTR